MTTATCILSVSSRRVPALDRLTITWGRDNAATQPTAATCTARFFADDAASAMQTYTIGRPVTVSSDITTYTTGTPIELPLAAATAFEGSLESGAIHADPDSPRNLATIVCPPAAHSDNPAAWDEMPTAVPGTQWTLTAEITLPAQGVMSVFPVYFHGPAAQPTYGPRVARTDTSGSLSASWNIPASAAGTWVGLSFQFAPTGPAWATSPQAWDSDTRSWIGLNTGSIRRVSLQRPREAAPIRAEVFAGTITDISLEYDEEARRPILSLTAADTLADLEHIYLGGEVWETQSLQSRIEKITRALPSSIVPNIVIDPVPAARTLIWQDVDNQSAASLLKSAATSAGAVMWAATHKTTGPYIRMEDPSTRGALGIISLVSGKIKTTALKAAHSLSASQLLRAGALTQSNSDAASVARLTWKQPGVDSDGRRTSTDHTITIEDRDLVRRIGYRAVSLSTSLAVQSQAEAAAARLFRTYLPGGFAIPHLTWDTRVHPDKTQPDTLAALLDATRRLGLMLSLTDLPDWYPARTITTFIDGGRYTYEKQRWSLELNATTTAATGRGLTWNQLPPGLTWDHTQPLSWAHTSSLTY